MEIKLLRVIKPGLKGNQYDYSMYQNEKGCFLIPLEVIYRNFLPPGSSVFKGLKDGEIKPQDLGLDRIPVPNQNLDNPILVENSRILNAVIGSIETWLCRSCCHRTFQ